MRVTVTFDIPAGPDYTRDDVAEATMARLDEIYPDGMNPVVPQNVGVRGDGSLYCNPTPTRTDEHGRAAYPREQLGEFRVNGRLVTDSFKLEHRKSGGGFYVDNFWGSLTDAATRTLLPILEDISAGLFTPEYAARKALASAESMAGIRRSDLLEALKAYREARDNVDRARAHLASIVGES